MQDISPVDNVKSLFDADRGVSPVIAVALLILIAIGFAVAIQGVGTDIVDSVQEPPEANIDGNPQEESIILTVESVQNADQLEIQIDGEEVDGEVLSGYDNNWNEPQSGLTAEIEVDYDDDDGDTQVQVIAINLPEDERVVYTYEVP